MSFPSWTLTLYCYMRTPIITCVHTSLPVLSCNMKQRRSWGRPPVDGEAIRDARLRKGWTQEQLQVECASRGTPVWNVSRIESGSIRFPNPASLVALADALELDMADLFDKAAA
jgi:hypothetical protein